MPVQWVRTHFLVRSSTNCGGRTILVKLRPRRQLGRGDWSEGRYLENLNLSVGLIQAQSVRNQVLT